MALVLKDRVKETTTTSGTGSITLLGAVQGYQGFSAIGEGNTTYYCIAGVAEWEVGIGTYSGGVLSRDTVLASSASGAKVGFSSGTKDVFCTYAADKSVTVDTLPVTTASNTDSPNNSVNVASLTAKVDTVSGDLALIPKGSGALLSRIPDGTSTGGDKRGLFAVDWQLSRSSSTQVASGLASSILSGSRNTSSGLYSAVAGGFTNTASGIYASVLGGTVNNATGSYSVTVGGQSNADLSSITHASIVGGYLNRVYGSYGVVVGGQSNNATVTGAVIVGGSNNAANGIYSFVSGGAYGTTRGITGMHIFPACNAPIAAAAGVSQAGLLVLGVQTTSATPVVMRSNSSAAGLSNQLVLADNSAVYFRGTVIANVTGGGNTKSWTFDGQIKRGANAAATTLTGSTVASPYGDAGASTWTVALSADTTNGGLAVTVTGQASTTIRWVCRLETTEVSY